MQPTFTMKIQKMLSKQITDYMYMACDDFDVMV